MGASIITPRGVQQTCNSGNMLDYAVASNSLVESLTLDPRLDVPWKAHLGLRLRMSKAPRAAMVKQLYVPQRTCKEEKDKDFKKQAEVRLGFGDKTEEQHIDFEEEEIIEGNMEIKGKCPMGLGGTVLTAIEQDAQEMGEAYAYWSHTVEERMMRRNNKKGKGFTGRGQMIKFMTGPAMKKQDDKEEEAGSQLAQMWRKISSRLEEKCKIMEEKDSNKVNHMNMLNEYLKKEASKEIRMLGKGIEEEGMDKESLV